MDVGTETIRTPRTLTGGWGIAIAASVVILIGLGIAGFVFGQLAGI